MTRRHTFKFLMFIAPLAACEGPLDPPPVEATRQPTICGNTDESQGAEQYDGTLGVTQGFVASHQRPVGMLRWRTNLATRWTSPGNVAGVNWCSGTMVSGNQFLTAGHCFEPAPGRGWILPSNNGVAITRAQVAQELELVMNFQNDPNGRPRSEAPYSVSALVEDRLGGLDYAIVRTTANVGNSFGYARVSRINAAVNDMVAIIGHPNGVPKQIEAGPVSAIGGTKISYNTLDTLGGSSGSGILSNVTNLLVGVHTNGGCTAMDGANFGVTIEGIKNVSAALLANKMSESDYDRDGKSDAVVFRPSEGRFHVLRANGTSTSVGWGTTGDQPVHGDFDNDGKADIGVWRPSNGTWFVIGSRDQAIKTTQWGAQGDIPVPGDYDADGWTDLAVWRPSAGTWHILYSATNTVRTVTWGISTDMPAPGDFNGDRKTDFAIFRRDDGNYHVWINGTATRYARSVGMWTDVPAPADYDGDGTTDHVVYRPTDGSWRGPLSATGTVLAQSWGLAYVDVPVPGDYNGDGRAELAVWRRTDGNWFTLDNVTGATTIRRWGADGDVPANRWPK